MKKLFSVLLSCILLLSLAACGQKEVPAPGEAEPETPATRTVTDSFGREVTIPAEVKTIVCTGSGALRMVTYLQCTDRLVGVEDCDKEYATSTLRDYAYVYHDNFDALPSIGKGGGTANTAYVEELFTVTEPKEPLPEKARIFTTLTCACCGEGVAEHMAHLQNGQVVCPHCFHPYDR